MKSTTRVVLIDPGLENRGAVEAALAAAGVAGPAAVCGSYPEGAEAVQRRGAEMVLVALDAHVEQALALIHDLVRARPDCAVIPLSRARDVDLVLRTIRAGAREFLTLPLDAAELRAALDRIAASAPVAGAATDAGERPASRVVALLGAAGGVGCTTLAVNLGATLARDPAREVALIDLDLVLGAVDASLDLVPDQTLADVARSVDRLDATLLKRSLTRHASGLYVLPSPATLEEAAQIEPDSLRQLLGRLRESFPTVLLDLSKSLQASDFLGLELAETILLVVQLEPACLRNAARMLDMLRPFPGMTEKVRVVANRVGLNHCEVSPKKAEELLRVPVPWLVPNEYKTFSAARFRGVPVEQDAPGSRAHRAILELARDFGAVEVGRARGGFGRLAASFF